MVILLYNRYIMSPTISLPASSYFTNRSERTQLAPLKPNYIQTTHSPKYILARYFLLPTSSQCLTNTSNQEE